MSSISNKIKSSVCWVGSGVLIAVGAYSGLNYNADTRAEARGTASTSQVNATSNPSVFVSEAPVVDNSPTSEPTKTPGIMENDVVVKPIEKPTEAVTDYYFGSQSLDFSKVSSIGSIQNRAADYANRMGLKVDMSWDFDGSINSMKPNIDKSCYYLSGGYVGCNHNDGFQLIFDDTTGAFVAVVANMNSINYKTVYQVAAHDGMVPANVTMEKGTYPAMVAVDFVK